MNESTNENDVLLTTKEQFMTALNKLGYTEEDYFFLLEPVQLLKMNLPLKLDDGTSRLFTAYRVKHTLVKGVTMGGVIFHPTFNEYDVQSLAMMMSVKTGIANLPFAGAKGLIVCDPRELSYREMERLSRSYIRSLNGQIGEHKDILTAEGQANTQMIAWMYDELSHFNDKADCAIIGKPFELGGTYSREKAIAISLITSLNETLKRNELQLNDVKMVIEGFGKVGSFLAQYAYHKGATVVGISDQYGGLYEEEGLDIDYLLDRRDSFGTVTKLFEKSMPVEELREKACDVLLLASDRPKMEPIHVEKLQTSIVIEATNHFMNLDQTDKLAQNDVFVVPYFVASVGNEIISYLEWLQAKQGYRWSANEVEQKLKTLTVQTFEEVSSLANRRKVDMRLASFMYSLRSLMEASRFRGSY